MNYEKPVVIENVDLAEGVFAASGAHQETAAGDSSQGTACDFTVAREQVYWGNDGEKTYTVTVPANSDTNLLFHVTFSEPVKGAYGLGGNWTLSADKKSADGAVYSISGQGEFTVQGPTSGTIVSFTRTK